MSKQTPSEALVSIAGRIAEKYGVQCDFAQDEMVVHAKRENIADLLKLLRDEAILRFEQLLDITAVDYPAKADRFEVVYTLLSLRNNLRARVKIKTDEDTPVPSVENVFSSAKWLEREVWDMYGIIFEGSADLRRILTDYGFEGHPLRKDFPLSGHVEVRYDEEQARVVYEPVTLTQEFRAFDNLSPWEAMTTMQLPGDEKGTKQKVGTLDYAARAKEQDLLK